MGFFKIFANDVGIDLGTNNTLVYVDKMGLLINEPSVVAIDINNNDIVAVGKSAYDMIGRTPGNILTIRALENGVIADYDVTMTMLKYFLDASKKGFSLLSSRVVVAIPSGITDVEKRAVEDAILQAGARDVLLVEESLASALGAGLPAFEPVGSMVVNIGGGITEIAVISMGGLVSSKTLVIGGDRFNQAIIDKVFHEYDTIIGDQTAEKIKLEIINLNQEADEVKLTVNGRDAISGLPKDIELSSKLISPFLLPMVYEIADGVLSVLEKTPPELAADVVEKGILLTGGSSRLNGLIEMLTKYSGMYFIQDDNPVESTCLGTGEILARFEKIKKARRKGK